jgi:hypothetical protein
LDNEFDKTQKECKRQSNVYARGHYQLTIDLSPGKERGFTLKVQNPFKRRTKENFG